MPQPQIAPKSIPLSQASWNTQSPIKPILTQLENEGILTDSISPRLVVKYWPPQQSEWKTRSLRDALFSFPKFPRLRNPSTIKRTISEGVAKCFFGYADKKHDGSYRNILFGPEDQLSETNVEISEDVVILPEKTAEILKKGLAEPRQEIKPVVVHPDKDDEKNSIISTENADFCRLMWEGEINPQQWMDFYTNVLSRFRKEDLRIKLKVDVQAPIGIPANKIVEMRQALKELGLTEDVKTET
jgi:hypothetical protein